MPISWTQSVGLQISGLDLRVVSIKNFFNKQRLAKAEVIEGFIGLPEDERLDVLKAFIRKHRLPPSRVYLTLAKDSGIVRQIEFPVQIAERVESAAALQIETLSPWPLDEVYWSCSWEHPPKGVKSLRATVVIVPRSTLDPWIGFFKKAGLPLSGASISASTCAHGASVLWGKSPSVILLGCETGSLEGVLVSSGQLVAVTAEGADLAVQAPSLVQRLLSLGGIVSPDRVTLFTHGSESEVLESDSTTLPLDGAVSTSKQYFGAIATAFLGLRKSAFDANLVPKMLRHRYSRILMIPTFVLAFLVLLLGVAWFVRAPYQTLIYAGQIDGEIAGLSSQVQDVGTQEAELERLNQRFVTLNAHIRNRDANLEMLRELSRVLPADAWISSYSYQDSGVSIGGLSGSASQVQKALEDSPVFKDAQQTATVIKDPTGKDRFSIRAALEQAR